MIKSPLSLNILAVDCCQVLTTNSQAGELTYKVPVMLQPVLCIGQTVIVPLGARLVEGVVTGFDEAPRDIELKEIVSISSKTPVFDEESLDASLIADSMSFSPPGTHLAKHLWKPPSLKVERRIVPTGIVAGLKPGEERLFELIMDLGDEATLGKINSRLGKGKAAYALRGLADKGVVRISDEVVSMAGKEKWHFEVSSDELREFSGIPKNIDTVAGLARATGLTATRINKYIKQGMISKVSDPKPSTPQKMEPVGFKASYHEGLRPSERIDLYARWANELLDEGRSMVVIAPTVAAAERIFGELSQKARVLMCTGGMNDSQTHDLGDVLEARSNAAVVGLASALLLPLANLSKVVVDEPLSPLYDTDAPNELRLTNLARIRAERSGCELALCGAPFGLEGVMAGSKPSPIHIKPDIVNMVFEIGASEQVLVSEGLLKAVSEEVKAGRPSVILLNRKGFSNFIFCDECGEVLKCPKCQIPLTYYTRDNSVSCRFCGFRGLAPETCPSCSSICIRFKAGGTERLRIELQKRLALGRILFAEGGERDSYRNLREFGKPGDVLVSTTMMLDKASLDGVRLVAIASLDGLLSMPIFSSTHKAYSLVSILASRLGPGGRVLIQTYMTHHPFFESIKENAIPKLLDEELEGRRETGYPPYTQILWWHVVGKEAEKSGRDALKVAARLKALLGDECVTGPNAGFFHRLKGGYRWDILIKLKDLRANLDILRTAHESLTSSGIKIEVTNPNQ